MIKMGQKVRDKITDYEGIITARIEYDNGCIQFCVKSKIGADGKMPEGQYIDIDHLEIVKEKKIEIASKPRGGDMPDILDRF